MANKHLFASIARRILPANTVNEAGGKAYRLEDRHALAQVAATGCFGTTYYAGQTAQLDQVLQLCERLDSGFIARTAIYARQRAHMKDMPALLLAVLATRPGTELERAFERVCDNGKMLRNFVQIVRSGVTGRRSLGSRPKRLVQRWLAGQSDAALLRASVGNDPSLADVIKMVHPTPADASRRALYGYLVGRPHDLDALPPIVKHYEAYKAGLTKELPDVPFQLLTSLPLDAAAWRQIARHARWQMTRMNLSTFARHGVFDDPALVELVARRLADPKQVQQARVFPYQLMVAHAQASADVPAEIRDALHDAMEVAVANVPRTQGPVYVLPDVSGSMHSPATGHRPGATSVVRCIDVAALVAAAFLRTNRKTEVLPFHDRVQPCALEARDSVLTNAKRLASLPSGGTDCAAPLRALNAKKARGDLVIFVSDNQSWIDTSRRWNPGTRVLKEWEAYKKRNPKAKLVCIDVQPYANTQAPERTDILNVGGFSDAVFSLVGAFAEGTLHPDHWVHEIERIDL
ncbi:MAG: TROVE domain-containing protein [Myxococcales bacterium]|nr:TROVE domain-containing protein [Myxococcales bacterium]